MRRAKNPRVYIYTDKLSKKKYFHDPVSNAYYWHPPEDTQIIDPMTGLEAKYQLDELFADYGRSIEKFEIKKIHKTRKSTTAPILEKIADPLPTIQRSRTLRKATLYNAFKKQGSGETGGIPIYLPQRILEDQKPFDTRKFATENFNSRTKGNIFAKKQIPPEELLVFSTDTSVYPILKSTPNTLQKKVISIFQLIQDYCKQNPKAQPSVLVEMIFQEKTLIDEVFIMLLKAIRNNPSEDDTMRIWDLILTICTFFPPSPQIQPLVRHVVACNALSASKTGISNIAKITYIRLAARCDCGEIFPQQPAQWTNLIPTHPVQDSFVFGAPLLELIYAQRRNAPKATIPLFMHHFAHELFAAGAKEMEGTFRLPGNKVQIDLMVQEIHNGRDVFKEAEICDLASLFKRWLGDLPEPIVPMAMYNDLVKALADSTVMDFVERLPKVNHDTLGYLVGFLKEFVQAESVTRMGIVPVSMIFGANVVRIVSNDPMVMKDMTENGRKFMEYLLINWDVGFIYPLPISFIPC